MKTVQNIKETRNKKQKTKNKRNVPFFFTSTCLAFCFSAAMEVKVAAIFFKSSTFKLAPRRRARFSTKIGYSFLAFENEGKKEEEENINKTFDTIYYREREKCQGDCTSYLVTWSAIAFAMLLNSSAFLGSMVAPAFQKKKKKKK
jgi:hypothetical protein